MEGPVLPLMERKEMKKFYEVSTRTLLIIAGIVWMIAGFNVARLGILSYQAIEIFWYTITLSAVVFLLFGAMFYKMTRKHIRRIRGYEEDFRPFWNFFDLKAYIIMTIMMGGGIGLRASGVVPDVFIAFFYTGLGCALFLAGVLFVTEFIRNKK